MGNFDVAMSTSALGMHNSLGDSLSVKLGKLINKMEVLKQDGSARTGSYRVLVVVNGVPPACGKSLSLH